MATIGLYVPSGVLSGARECLLPLQLLLHLWPQVPHLRQWAAAAAAESKAKHQLNPARVLEAMTATEPLMEAQDPPGLSCTLYDYQRESLHWMRTQEQASHGVSSHMWFAVLEGALWYSMLLGRFSCEPPEQNAAGGLLCDELGLGKTVEIISLVLSMPASNRAAAAVASEDVVDERVGGTLVVCPVSLVGQWKKEIELRAPAVSVGVYYGKPRTRIAGKLGEYDVVLTTYGVMLADHVAKGTQAALTAVMWHRVVLDESQQLR